MPTIDFIDNIELDPKKIGIPIENIHALEYLKEGINFLYGQVSKIEEEKRQGIKICNGVSCFAVKTAFHAQFNSGDSLLLANYFNWFAVSLINYCKLVALIDYVQKNGSKYDNLIKEHKEVNEYTSSYCSKVAEDVYLWRKKIAAHLSITDPRKKDLESTLCNSLINSIALVDSRYKIGAFVMLHKGETPDLKSWSLTEVYEKLVPRFWP